MRNDVAEIVARCAGLGEGRYARLVRGDDGRSLLQAAESMIVVQLETSGRPDGLRPGGFSSTLEWLEARVMGAAAERDPVTPLDWMELDREFAQYHQRRRAAFSAAAYAQTQQEVAAAELLYRLAAGDAQHCLDIIAFARRRHPARRLPGTALAIQSTLVSLRYLADALRTLLTGDVPGANAILQAGRDDVATMLHASGMIDHESHASIRDLERVAQALGTSGADAPGQCGQASLQPAACG